MPVSVARPVWAETGTAETSPRQRHTRDTKRIARAMNAPFVDRGRRLDGARQVTPGRGNPTPAAANVKVGAVTTAPDSAAADSVRPRWQTLLDHLGDEVSHLRARIQLHLMRDLCGDVQDVAGTELYLGPALDRRSS